MIPRGRFLCLATFQAVLAAGFAFAVAHVAAITRGCQDDDAWDRNTVTVAIDPELKGFDVRISPVTWAEFQKRRTFKREAFDRVRFEDLPPGKVWVSPGLRDRLDR